MTNFFIVCTGDWESGYENYRNNNWELQDEKENVLASWGHCNMPPCDTSTREVSEEVALEIIKEYAK
jgi:hypothetical protein